VHRIESPVQITPRCTRTTLTLALLAVVLNAIPCRAQSNKGLWVCNFDFFDEFQGASLQKSGRSNATLGLNSEQVEAFPDLAFDKKGNLWTLFGQGVGELTRGELTTGKARFRLHVLLSEPGPLYSPTSLALDPAGDLWVTSVANVTGGLPYNLVEFTPGQLTASGSPTPASTIMFPNGSGIVPNLVRFDSAGDLWLGHLVSLSGPPAIVEYTPAQVAELQSGGSPTPTLTVEAPSSVFELPAIAFDPKGNLWIAAYEQGGNPDGVDGGTLEMFQLAGKSGTLSEPDITITPTAISSINQSLDAPSGLAFDDRGGLWVSDRASSDQISGSRNSSGFLVKFAAEQLTASGSPLPPIVITPNRKASNLYNPQTLIFGPTVK
jgi:sugar lactone lactonase YvrE